MSKDIKKFKYNVPTSVFFYSPVCKAVTIKECGHQTVGQYQGKFVYEGVSTVVVEESSFAVPGVHFLNLLEKADRDFCDRLFQMGVLLTRLGDNLQEIYYQDVKGNLISDLNKFYPQYLAVFTPAIGVGYSLDYAFDQYIKRHSIDPTSIIPAGLSFQAREKLELKEIFEIADNSKKDKKLEEHRMKYAWLLNNYTGEHSISPNYFLERKAEVKSFTARDNGMTDKKPKTIQEWMSLLIFIRDERKRVNMMANGLLDRYLKKECKERNIEYANAVMCTIEEFEEKKHRPASIPIRPKRILKFTDKGPVDIADEEWEKIIFEDQQAENVLKGQIASKGVAQGIARIVLDRSDFSKVNEGDVIVASMTRPEYAPILGKCVAIVTNEGGITCHAAIVSRELKIPCIIGTREATNFLKDGDLIEVNANSGVVRKL